MNIVRQNFSMSLPTRAEQALSPAPHHPGFIRAQDEYVKAVEKRHYDF